MKYKTLAVVIGLAVAAVNQDSVALAVDARSAEGVNLMLRHLDRMSPEQWKERQEKERAMQPTLTSWNAGRTAFARLDSRKKFSIKKLGSNNVLKIAKAEARKQKAEFQNVFVMGFISECYQLKVTEVEEAAKKMRLKKDLTEIVSVVNYLQ